MAARPVGYSDKGSAHRYRTRTRLWAMRLLLLLGLFTAPLMLSHCGERHALLLTVASTDLVETFDLRVMDLDNGGIVLDRRDERITTPDDPNRDISQPGQELKLALEFAGPGHYLVHMLGRSGQGNRWVVALRDFNVRGVTKGTIKLIALENDADEDRFPSCTAYPDCSGLEATFSCAYLDCDDSDSKVNPFGSEVCGNGKDDDCSAHCGARLGEGDVPCEDADGDGVPVSQDCDDTDPCRSPNIVEAPNLCKFVGGVVPELPQACLDKLAAEGREAVAPFCGDGVDQDCNGRDAVCVVDEDCDGFSPPKDCDDTSAAINTAATEICDGTDNNCNGVTDEGCVPCDVDGDAHAAPGSTDPSCDLPKDDPDDYDAGVHPGTTVDTGGAEGGTVPGALRRFCSADLNRAGVAQRDIDHDGDELAAKDDGCPSTVCDADGDGFARAGCGDPPPPVGKVDCDDDDPHVFPGAPDICGDGKAQNCLDDACAADLDEDGYATPGDCNDDPNDPMAPQIHPWATEICDGVDNDCDGLIDEGNPDDQGNLISTAAPLCSDSNAGQCAPCPGDAADCDAAERQMTGTCACSRQTPVRVSQPSSDRVACAGEDEGAVASQRCFGANQPRSEKCDPLDWDCNGKADAPNGENLADRGHICSVERGTCSQGEVSGCDLSKTVPNLAAVRAVQPEFNEHWTCTDAVLPIPELCNGRDDNCDGQPPATDEEDDFDSDGYLACSGCQPEASAPHDWAPGVIGCDDCNDDQPTIHPNADDLCNNIDENCNGPSDNGASECTGTTPNCCSGPGLCVDLQKDFNNCHDCGHVCDSNVADKCAAGVCVCGNTGGPCTGGLVCDGGVCKCLPNRLCNGCCDGNVCQPSSPEHCGVNGASCDPCSDSKECTNDLCSAEGACSNPNFATGTPCPSGNGKCDKNAVCCAGCIDDANSCHTDGPTSISFCGKNGADCQACTAGECRTPVCANGICGENLTALNGTGCSSDGKSCTDDKCNGGSCTHTLQSGSCLISGTCVGNGTHDPSNDCKWCDSSPGGSTSAWSNRASGQSCQASPTASGLCDGEGLCCTGCFDVPGSGGICNQSPDVNACGVAGGVCQDCALPDSQCTENLRCNLTTGNCEYDIKAGWCLIDVGAPGSPDLRCYANSDHNPANDCQECKPSASKTAWTNRQLGTTSASTCTLPDDTAGHCGKDSAAPGAPVTCCTGCLDGSNVCQVGTTNLACGNGGGACAPCQPSDVNCQTATCTAGGNCNRANLDNTHSCSTDNLACTADKCDGAGGCAHTLDTSQNSCWIGNNCYAPGDRNPDNDCQECAPDLGNLSTFTTWSNRGVGVGVLCTTPSASAGACGSDHTCCPGCLAPGTNDCKAGTSSLFCGNAREVCDQCDDSLSCTNDTCNASQRCDNQVTTGCLIGGSTCVGEGTDNPVNDCEKCAHSSDPVGWTPKGLNTACGAPGTASEGQCNGAGDCCTGCMDTSNGNTCVPGTSDVNACSNGGNPGDPCQTCTAPGTCTSNPSCTAGGTCTFTLANSKCYIDGRCRNNNATLDNDETANPAFADRDCIYCDGTAADQSAREERAYRSNSTSCNDGTSDGTCDGFGHCAVP